MTAMVETSGNEKVLRTALGNYTGESLLHMAWLEDESQRIHKSPSSATVSETAQSTAIQITYQWEFEGTPQSGTCLLTFGDDHSATAAWTDSWHMVNQILHSKGEWCSPSEVSVLGHYAAPPGPDWGWRSTFSASDSGGFRLQMFNIMPDGTEIWAVDANYLPTQ
jgi:hypothetical protein